jgi:hypothetical protein
MAEGDELGKRLVTMLEHAAGSAEGQTEVALRNLKADDEGIKAQREAIEVQRRAAEAETRAAEACIASAKAAERAVVAAERNTKYMLWSIIVASISAIPRLSQHTIHTGAPCIQGRSKLKSILCQRRKNSICC